jgi:uncharacterized protein (DUF1015 family)
MTIKPFYYLYPDYQGIFDLSEFFAEVKNNYPELKRQGIYFEGNRKSIFVYRIKTKLRDYHGIIAAVDVEDYFSGLIKKHENTLVAQENNISRLMVERDGIIKPVLLAYNQNKSIKNLIVSSFLGKKPKFTIRFDSDQQIHELYRVSDSKLIKEFQKQFADSVNKAYIADGHHRMASISKLIQENPELRTSKLNSMMCALFDFNELSICAYHRIVELPLEFDFLVFLKKIKSFTSIKKIKKVRFPERKGELIYLYGEYQYSVTWKKVVNLKVLNPTKVVFDIDVFNKRILDQIFEIKDVRTDPKIQYLEGSKSLKQIIKIKEEKPNSLFVLFYPVKSTDFTKVADKHQVLPPKSTWFEPRIRNGIIVQDFNHHNKK